MKFGPRRPADAIGGVTVHSLRQNGLLLKKGTTIGPAEVAALEKAGIAEIVVVQLEPGDVSEDVAAADVAGAVAGDGVTVDRAFTGRANLAKLLVAKGADSGRTNSMGINALAATFAWPG